MDGKIEELRSLHERNSSILPLENFPADNISFVASPGGSAQASTSRMISPVLD
jgi:hypothetical protein